MGGCAGTNYPFLTSQERDNETGLDYMHARYFASVQGRFSSADSFGGSIENPQSLNRYTYVVNNPINLSDPTGHEGRYNAHGTTYWMNHTEGSLMLGGQSENFIAELDYQNQAAAEQDVARQGAEASKAGQPQNTLTIEHFEAKQESWVRYELQKILSPKCAKAYNAEGLRSPSQIIDSRGVMIRPAEDLHRSAADLHLDERIRKDSLSKIFTAQAGTVFGTDGSLQIYLNVTAFFGPSWDRQFLSLAEVLKHEFIHEYIHEWASPWHPFSHDLSGYPGYYRIMEGCK